jgi:hypothetical protein
VAQRLYPAEVCLVKWREEIVYHSYCRHSDPQTPLLISNLFQSTMENTVGHSDDFAGKVDDAVDNMGSVLGCSCWGGRLTNLVIPRSEEGNQTSTPVDGI